MHFFLISERLTRVPISNHDFTLYLSKYLWKIGEFLEDDFLASLRVALFPKAGGEGEEEEGNVFGSVPEAARRRDPPLVLVPGWRPFGTDFRLYRRRSHTECH